MIRIFFFNKKNNMSIKKLNFMLIQNPLNDCGKSFFISYGQKPCEIWQKFSIVVAQMYEFSYTENPPNCVGGIRELFYCLVIVSLLLALLLNTSRSLLLLPGLYSGDPLVSFDKQPIEDQHGEQQQQESSPPS